MSFSSEKKQNNKQKLDDRNRASYKINLPFKTEKIYLTFRKTGNIINLNE